MNSTSLRHRTPLPPRNQMTGDTKVDASIPASEAAPPSTTVLRSRLDREILKLEYALSHLKARRNALVPVASLPAEILSTIFVLARDASVKLQPRNSEWIAISHTCQHSRRVAMACAAFWSHIDLSSQSWANILYERSKNSPVISAVVLWAGRDLQWLICACGEGSRLQSLIIEDKTFGEVADYDQERLKILLSNPARERRRFHLALPAQQVAFLMPCPLFGGVNATLVDLSLINCELEVSTLAFLPNLGSLSVARTGVREEPWLPETRLRLQNVPEILRQARNLVQLTLVHAGPGGLQTIDLERHSPANDDTRTSSRSHSLLQSLDLTDEALPGAMLLTRLDVPLETLRLDCAIVRKEDPYALRVVFAFTIRFLTHRRGARLTQVRLRQSQSTKKFILEAWPDTQETHDEWRLGRPFGPTYVDATEPCFRLELQHFRHGSYYTISRAACEVFPLAEVSTLTTLGGDAKNDAFLRVFPHLTSCRTLFINVTDFIRATSSYRTDILPALNRLGLFCFTVDWDPVGAEVVTDWLERRLQRRGVTKLSSVIVCFDASATNASMDEWVTSLKAHVGEVRVMLDGSSRPKH